MGVLKIVRRKILLEGVSLQSILVFVVWEFCDEFFKSLFFFFFFSEPLNLIIEKKIDSSSYYLFTLVINYFTALLFFYGIIISKIKVVYIWMHELWKPNNFLIIHIHYFIFTVLFFTQ